MNNSPVGSQRSTMTNLNRRGSLSVTSIEATTSFDSVFTDETGAPYYTVSDDDDLVNGLIPRIATSLSSPLSKKHNSLSTRVKRDLTRTRSLPGKIEIAFSDDRRKDLPGTLHMVIKRTFQTYMLP